MKLLVLLALVTVGAAYRMCQNDEDCADLGDLQCLKSACSWGNCGCRRGYASRYAGSTKKFRCVKLKKIGEECSTDGTKGVCGASNADCVNSICECDAGFETRWGGEECLSKQLPYPTESCGTALGGACGGSSTCAANGAWNGQYTGTLASVLQNTPYDDTPNTCACASGYRTELPNDFYEASFMGGSLPKCVKIAVGDLCFVDDDCGEIYGPDGSGGWATGASAVCTNNVCVCGSGHVSDISGLFCAPEMSYGDVCMVGNVQVDSTVGVCNGDNGLRCGDPCDLQNYLDSGNSTCQCDPAYTDNSGTCTANVEGDTCNGDLNCKAIGENAVCTDGVCSSVAAKLQAVSVFFAIGLALFKASSLLL